MKEAIPIEHLSEGLATAVVWRNLESDPPPRGVWVMLAFRMGQTGSVHAIVIAKVGDDGKPRAWGPAPITLSSPEDARWSYVPVPVWLP
jgi:hypothetical protein